MISTKTSASGEVEENKKMAEKYKLEFTSFLEFDQFQIYIEKTCLLNGILLLIIIEMWRMRDTTVSNTFKAPNLQVRR